MLLRTPIAAGLTVLSICLAAPGALAATITVDDDGTGPGPAGATCDAPDYAALSDAIAGAVSGDQILVCAGEYVDDDVVVDKTLSIRGVSPAGGPARELLHTGTLATVLSTSGPGQGPTVTLRSPLMGPAPAIELESIAIVGNDDFDTIRVESNDPTPIHSLALTRVAITGSRTALNTAGLRPVHGLTLTDSAVRCTGASNPTGGVLLGMADAIGAPVSITGNYMTACGWAINAGGHAGVGIDSPISGAVSIAGNTIEETEYGCILIALGYEDMAIEDNSLTNCDRQPSPWDAAINLQATAAATHVKVRDNEITRSAPTTAGNVGVIVQNVGAGAAGARARFDIERNRIVGLDQSTSSAAVRLGPTPILRTSDDLEVNVVANTLTGNARGFDWQTNAGAAVGGNLRLNGNRIAGNSGRGVSVFGPDRALDARGNWWGCNAGPQVSGASGPTADGCDSIGIAVPDTSSVDGSDHLSLVLATSAPRAATGGAPVQVTARIRAADDTTASGFPDGTPIGFAVDSAPAGDVATIAPAIATTTGGEATATLTPGAAAGTAVVAATLDGHPVEAGVEIFKPASPAGPEPPSPASADVPSPPLSGAGVRSIGPGLYRVAHATTTVGRDGRVRFATVGCKHSASYACRTLAVARIRIGGRTYLLVARRTVRRGSSAELRFVLPPAAKRRLRGTGSAQGRVRFVMRSGRDRKQVHRRIVVRDGS